MRLADSERCGNAELSRSSLKDGTLSGSFARRLSCLGALWNMLNCLGEPLKMVLTLGSLQRGSAVWEHCGKC